MALLLPRCAPSESLHQLAFIRQLRLSVHHRSRRSARSNHGSTESTTKTQAASTDHIRIPSSEPCCILSPLIMSPRKSVRRSSRLRVKKGRDDAKTDLSDMEAAEWVSRALTNNGAVEVDPLTIAEQISAAKSDSNNTYNPIASLTTSSEVPDYFPPGQNGFPRVPFGVALAAGSAVVLATIALLLQTLTKRRAGSNPNSLSSSFAGEPVNANATTAKQSSNGSPSRHRSKDKKLPADVLASAAGVSAGAAILTNFDHQGTDYSSMPLPPSLSKAGSKRETQPRRSSAWDSVTPFFASDRSSVSSSPRQAPSVASWPEGKYNSIAPFFPSDRLAANGSSSESVTPFFPDEQGSFKRDSGSSLETVTPFFPDEQGSIKRDSGLSLETVTPFFTDEQGSIKRDSGLSLEAVTPFFTDEQGSIKRDSGLSLEAVTPFFTDEQGVSSSKTPSQSKASSGLENISPFFPDDRVGRSDNSAVRSSPSQFREQSGIGSGETSGAQRDSLANAMSPGSVTTNAPRMVNLSGNPPVKSSQFTNQRSVGEERVFAPIPQDILSGAVQSEGKQILAEMAKKSQEQHEKLTDGTTEERLGPKMTDAFSFHSAEAPAVQELSAEELAFLAEMKAEEERRYAKFQALQAAFPAVAIGAGALGALVGVDGALEMVGLTATASFISYELLWANKRKELLEEMSRITDHNKLFNFLQKRKIVKDDC